MLRGGCGRVVGRIRRNSCRNSLTVFATFFCIGDCDFDSQVKARHRTEWTLADPQQDRYACTPECWFRVHQTYIAGWLLRFLRFLRHQEIRNFLESRDAGRYSSEGTLLELGSVKQSGGKIVAASAFEADCDPGAGDQQYVPGRVADTLWTAGAVSRGRSRRL